MPSYGRAYAYTYHPLLPFPGELNFLLVNVPKLCGSTRVPRAVLMYFRQVVDSVFYFVLWGYFLLCTSAVASKQIQFETHHCRGLLVTSLG